MDNTKDVQSRSPPKVFIGGGPSSGKSTQAEFLADELGLVHINVDELVKEDTISNRGGVETKLADESLIAAIKSRIQEPDCISKGWILDGFPFHERQVFALTLAGIECDIFVHLDVDIGLLQQRCADQLVDPVTKKSYSSLLPPTDSKDVVERLTRRYVDASQVSAAVATYFSHLTGLVKSMEGKIVNINANKSSDLVRSEIRHKVSRKFLAEVIFVLGGPGSGKGTLCGRLVYEFGYVHLSAGDLLREERSKSGPMSDMINRVINDGGIVPAEVTVALLATAMKDSGSKKFLVDGFPRNYENMMVWYELMAHQTVVDFVINLDLDEETMKQRLLERGKSSGRSDDNEATIVKRFRTFTQDTMPVLNTFNLSGKLRTISSVPPPEVVFAEAAKLFTSLKFFPPYQRTFGFIKPDAVRNGKVPAILAAIADANLVVVASKLVQITPEVAGDFYKEHQGKPFFPSLQQFMTSGPSVALVIEGSYAIRAWRQLMGPTSTSAARSKAPSSLRARFGTDNTMNACHGSDSDFSAMREIRFWMDPKGPGASCEIGFSASVLSIPRNALTGLPTEDTFAMIKPATATIHAEAILSIVAAHGFQVISRLHSSLSLALAQQFYEEHRGKDFYGPLTQYMSSGPIVALHLRRAGAIVGWRHLIGPTNLDKAVAERPDSIRANFGIDKTRNAVHGSDSSSSAERELRFFFSFGGTAAAASSTTALGMPTTSKSNPSIPFSLSPVKVPPGKAASNNRIMEIAASMSRRDIPSMQQYASYEVDPVMQALLEKVMIARPPDVASFAIAELTEIKTRGKNKR